jgi:hypothetical protein
MGGWDVARAVGVSLDALHPGLTWRDHDLMTAIQSRQIEYYGDLLDISETVTEATRHLLQEVLATTSQLWNGGADLHAILITGGGAHLIGDDLKAVFDKHRNVIVLPDPVFANAKGYLRYARFLQRGNT